MKPILLFSFLLAAVNCFAQNLKAYKASNGITYKVGDTLKLGKGSGENGTFLFFQLGGWKNSDPKYFGERDYADSGVLIKRIKMHQLRGNPKMVFTVGGGNIINYTVRVEEAIESCEVIPCKEEQQGVGSVADELLKFKHLLDAGAITQGEYEGEKKKLLKN